MPLRTLARIASLATYPLRPSDYLNLIDPRFSHRQLRGLVTSVTPQGPDAATIAVRPGPDWTPHRAGQWLQVGVDIDGARHWRPFSVSSPEGGALTFTVNAVGRVSSALVHDTRVGDVLFLAAPQGDFVLPERPGKLLFLTAGSGATPAMSMAATLAASGGADAVWLHSARDADHNLFAADRAALAASGITGIDRLTSVDGRLDLGSAAELDALVPDWRERRAYVCGPAALNDAAVTLWASEGVDAPVVERFTLARHDGEVGEGGHVTFARSHHELDADGATPLLVAGEDAGLELRSGCRMGICRTCLCTLSAGQVRNLTTGEVHGEPGDMIRTCVSAAAGDITLEA